MFPGVKRCTKNLGTIYIRRFSLNSFIFPDEWKGAKMVSSCAIIIAGCKQRDLFRKLYFEPAI
jgi:hypothetical protein